MHTRPARAVSGTQRLLLGSCWFLVVLTCLRVWLGSWPAAPSAAAQLPDPAQQRLALIDEVRRTNVLLSDIKRILERETLNVRLQGADNPADRPARGAGDD